MLSSNFFFVAFFRNDENKINYANKYLGDFPSIAMLLLKNLKKNVIMVSSFSYQTVGESDTELSRAHCQS